MHKLVTKFFASLGLLALLLGPPASAGSPAVGALAPPALGLDLAGQPLRLESLRGRVVVLSFWASWCAPCLEEMKVLENLQARVGSGRLCIVGVNWRESRRAFRRLAERLGPLAITLASDADGQAGAQYGVSAIPRLFVIDAQGRLAFSHEGYDPQLLSGPLLEEIAALLSAPEAAHAMIPP